MHILLLLDKSNVDIENWIKRINIYILSLLFEETTSLIARVMTRTTINNTRSKQRRINQEDESEDQEGTRITVLSSGCMPNTFWTVQPSSQRQEPRRLLSEFV